MNATRRPQLSSNTAVVAARKILQRLHEVMAARTPPQVKLNKIVSIIASELSSEVCSIYLLREGMLELFATRGLKQEAVHVTRLALGEGLVGTIAGTINGLLIAYGKVVPFITTLAMLASARGLAEIIADRKTQIIRSQGFLDFFQAEPLGIPVIVIIFALVAVRARWKPAPRSFPACSW